MNDSTKAHWSEDPELLERYILNRLEAARRQELEAHLGTCSVCQRVVLAEQKLVAGVRRLGRDELKARLKRRLASAGSREIRVPRTRPAWVWQIASAAAVVVLLLGIGIFNHWFTFYEEKQIEEPRQVGKLEDRISEAEKEGEETSKDDSKFGAREEAKSTAPIETVPPAAAEGALRSADERSRADELERDKSAEKRRFEGAPVPVPDAAGAGAAERPEPLNLSQVQSQEPVGEQTVWVEGTLLKSPKIFAKQAEQSAKSKVSLEAGRSRRLTLRQDGNTQTFTLQQKLNDALPSSRKLKQTQLQGQKVQTLVERTEEGLAMTLYLDAPVEESELREATIQPVNADSLIVNLKDQRIGYRIPGGWSAQATTKTKSK